MKEVQFSAVKAPALPQIESFEKTDGRLAITWTDEHKSLFHYVWLYDNCYCEECGALDTEKRVLHLLNLPLDIHPQGVSLKGPILQIAWSNGHVSSYDPAWLRAHCYSAQERRRRHWTPVLWDRHLSTQIPEIEYRSVADGSTDHLKILEAIRNYGFVIMRGIGPEVERLEEVAKLFGYVQETYYGRVTDIRTLPNAKTITDTPVPIMPHTDEIWRSVPVGIIFFHCVQDGSTGGETILLDGFRVAEALRDSDPNAFRTLSQTPWEFYKYSADRYELSSNGRLIAVDEDDRVVGFRYSLRFRAPLDVHADLVEDVYGATKKLMALVLDPDYQLRIRLRPGDIVAVDNHRVVHGRTAFEGARHLRYCYVNRDDFQGRLRVLEQAHGLAHGQVLPRGALA